MESYIALIQIVVYAVVYAYFSFCLQKIAAKTDTKNGWFAWLPIFNVYLVCKIAKKPVWWILLLFIPLINIFFVLILSMELATACHKSSWIGALVLIPGVNLFIPGYLAFSKPDISSNKLSLQEGDETMDSIAGELKADQEEEASSAEKGTMDSIAGELKADQEKEASSAEKGTMDSIAAELKADQEKEASSAEKGTMDSITAELKADQVKGASAAENGVLARITVPLKADQEKNGLVVFTQQEKNAGESSEIFSYIILGIAVIFGLFVIYLFLKWEGFF